MGLPDDLFEQAIHLASREPGKPRQASLRRAVSAAYDALFHLMVDAGTRMLARTQPRGLRAQVRRAFTHRDMKAVCRQLAHGNVNSLSSGTANMVSSPIEAELKNVAGTFVQLQEARHDADYDLSMPLARVDVLQMIAMVQKAFADWKAIRTNQNTTAFLAALLLQRHWDR